MLVLLSPAKTLDFDSPRRDLSGLKNVATQPKKCLPEYVKEAERLMDRLREFTPQDLRELMGISESLAELNHSRFADWQPSVNREARWAVFAFQGDVYQGLQADQWTDRQLEYAQDHLRILSGLYGILRPLDLIQAYRLEMGSRFDTGRGNNLYEFWGDRITQSVQAALADAGSKILLNLASAEYFRSIQHKALPCPVIAPVFKEKKNGEYKMITFFAKQARGTMADWVIRKRVKTTNKLIQFAEDGYRYDESSSTESKPVFLRG